MSSGESGEDFDYLARCSSSRDPCNAVGRSSFLHFSIAFSHCITNSFNESLFLSFPDSGDFGCTRASFVRAIFRCNYLPFCLGNRTGANFLRVRYETDISGQLLLVCDVLSWRNFDFSDNGRVATFLPGRGFAFAFAPVIPFACTTLGLVFGEVEVEANTFAEVVVLQQVAEEILGPFALGEGLGAFAVVNNDSVCCFGPFACFPTRPFNCVDCIV